jgi:hypothetical protein
MISLFLFITSLPSTDILPGLSKNFHPNVTSRYGSGEPGKPPCERCIRENHECVLGPSHRGGRRIKHSATDSEPPESIIPQHASSSEEAGPSSIPSLPDSAFHRRLPSWPQYPSTSKGTPGSTTEAQTSQPTTRMTVDETIASANLQNPSDALEFLANVAGRTEGAQSPSVHDSIYARSPHPSGTIQHAQDITPSSAHPSPSINQIHFPPYQKGYVSLDMIQSLLDR